MLTYARDLSRPVPRAWGDTALRTFFNKIHTNPYPWQLLSNIYFEVLFELISAIVGLYLFWIYIQALHLNSGSNQAYWDLMHDKLYFQHNADPGASPVPSPGVRVIPPSNSSSSSYVKLDLLNDQQELEKIRANILFRIQWARCYHSLTK